MVSAEEVKSIPRAHHIHRPPEEQCTAKSQDSTIWVNAAGAILMGEEGSPERGAQTSQAHMDPSIQPQSQHPPSAVVLESDAMNSTETEKIHEGSRIRTR